MRPTKLSTLACAAMLAAVPLAACGSSGSNSSSSAHPTLTYWASNQGTSLQNDKDVLGPELAKFEKQTGIHVDLQVIAMEGWRPAEGPGNTLPLILY